ncbi:hypothetical protein GCM10023194_28340 [Planotetraspora phitsanulokensis]|uniref:Uncharacterized protein n=1 Tax=Planotetraspora phitsanulokensis TaxID=575192 RepID=A0A8J3U4T1_9ACTN|nr:hypothetical protein Pph01_10320 [Planotetraspora phitsanulokensis]
MDKFIDRRTGRSGGVVDHVVDRARAAEGTRLPSPGRTIVGRRLGLGAGAAAGISGRPVTGWSANHAATDQRADQAATKSRTGGTYETGARRLGGPAADYGGWGSAAFKLPIQEAEVSIVTFTSLMSIFSLIL